MTGETMDKNKWKKEADALKEKLRFLRLDEDLDDEDEEDDLQIEEKELAPGRELPEGNLKEKLEWNRRRTAQRRIFWVVLVTVIAGSFILYNRYHAFQDYFITETSPAAMSSGTRYETVGKKLFRYNSDGVSCISRDNEIEWSVTYSMQAVISDICGSTMVIAEQQGTQVYVVNAEGELGSFETQVPILKARVSRQGVVALVLQDEEVTWVSLYRPDGTLIANDKTSWQENGYPMDIDLSPDGKKLAVSYLGTPEGVLTSRVVFYHFGGAGKDQKNHVVSSAEYPGAVIPEIYFNDNSCAVAVADNGFYVFRGNDKPKESASVQFESEIISSFHDGERVGFLFLNDDADSDREYRMELYNYKGRRKVSRKIDAKFDRIKIEHDQILLYDDGGFDVFTKSGHLRFTSAYEKEVEEFFYFGEYRKYLVITKDSFDWIRIE